MQTFFVEIKCALGRTYEVASALAEAEIASEIYSIAGNFDILAKFYVERDVDIGHFVAGDFGSPLPFLKAHHDRITHIHIKDRKAHEGENTPFGLGETPITAVLQTLRDNKWPIQATIEFEYKVPDGSDRMAEMVKCVEFCKQSLLSKS